MGRDLIGRTLGRMARLYVKEKLRRINELVLVLADHTIK